MAIYSYICYQNNDEWSNHTIHANLLNLNGMPLAAFAKNTINYQKIMTCNEFIFTCCGLCSKSSRTIKEFFPF